MNTNNPYTSQAWTRLLLGAPHEQGRKVVDLGDFIESVNVSAGETQSFYVYSRVGLLCTNIPNESLGEVYGSDRYITIQTGKVTNGLWRRVQNDHSGKWAGAVRYYTD